MINLYETPEKRVFITSDTHFGHQRDFVWKARGYSSVEEHDAGVIASINTVVRENDILFHLGDFCLNTPFDKFDVLLDSIKCQNIYHLFGNHNNPHEKNVYRKLVGDKEQYPVKYKNITYYGHYMEAILNGQFVVLCHYPIYIWNEQNNGAWMLCGHSHYGCPFSRKENFDAKILDVGWDGHGQPWSMEEVKKVMATKQFIALDKHHK